MLKGILIVAAVLVISVVFVVAMGYALPRKHTAARAILLPRQPAEVFALISDFKNAPAWRGDLRVVEILPPVEGRTRFREKGKHGDLTMEVVELNPPSRLVTRIADPELPFSGTWTNEIVATAEGCRLNIIERGEVRNPVFRFVSRFIIGHTATLDLYLRNVARKFGSSAMPEDGIASKQ
jgi:uncharacterized protein YndB with AHSA1/START domain